MKEIRSGTCAAVLIACVLLLFGFLIASARTPNSATSSAWIEFTITEEDARAVDVYGDIVVYAQADPWRLEIPSVPLPLYDIYIYDIFLNQFTKVADDISLAQGARIDGEWVAFIRITMFPSQVMLRNIVTGEMIDLWLSDVHPGGINMHNGILVIGSYSVSSDDPDYPDKGVLVYDIVDRSSHIIPPSLNLDATYPDIYDQTVVWQQSLTVTQDYNIVGYDLSAQNFFTVSAEPGDELHPRIDGQIVVWEWNGDIYGYDLAQGERLTITTASGTQSWPAISENWVVWESDQNGTSDIYAYDLGSDEKSMLVGSFGERPAIDDEVIAWEQSDAAPLDGIRAAWHATEFVYLPLIAREMSTQAIMETPDVLLYQSLFAPLCQTIPDQSSNR